MNFKRVLRGVDSNKSFLLQNLTKIGNFLHSTLELEIWSQSRGFLTGRKSGVIADKEKVQKSCIELETEVQYVDGYILKSDDAKLLRKIACVKLRFACRPFLEKLKL